MPSPPRHVHSLLDGASDGELESGGRGSFSFGLPRRPAVHGSGRTSRHHTVFGAVWRPEWEVTPLSGCHGKRTMSSPKQSLLRNIPPVEALLADPQLQHWADRLSRDVLRAAVRTAVAGVREQLLAESPGETDPESLHRQIVARAVLRHRCGHGTPVSAGHQRHGSHSAHGAGTCRACPRRDASTWSMTCQAIQCCRSMWRPAGAGRAIPASSGCCSNSPAPRQPRS